MEDDPRGFPDLASLLTPLTALCSKIIQRENVNAKDIKQISEIANGYFIGYS